jgi:hypothetical protein
MLCSTTTKPSPVTVTATRIVTTLANGSIANGQAVRADGLGNIYYAGDAASSPSNYSIYNTVTGSLTSGLATAVNFNDISWDVDAAGRVYTVNSGAISRLDYGQFTSVTGTAYTKSFCVKPDGTTCYLEVNGDLTVYNGVPSSVTSNVLLSNAYGSGQVVSCADSYGNVYIGGRADIATPLYTLKVTDGGVSSSFSSNTYANNTAISVDRSSGNVVIATPNAVYRVSPTKDVLLASGFTRIQGLAVDPVSKICYVYETGGAVPGIYKLTPNY